MNAMSNAVMDAIASIGNQDAVLQSGDFVGEDGLIRCGKCGEKKETVLKLKIGEQVLEKRCRCLCKCGMEERKQREEKAAIEEQAAKIQRIKDASLMDTKFYEAKFKNARATNYNRKNLNLCKKYADSFPRMMEKNQGLLFWGDVGTGKSFGAACIANALMESYTPVIMTSFVKMVDMIRAKEQYDKISGVLASAKLVIFDDLGAERNTDYAVEKVYDIVDSRYRSGLPMIVTTNLSLDEMFMESDLRYSRIYDRIFETCFPVQWTGPSWRKTQAKRRFDEMSKLLEE